MRRSSLLSGLVLCGASLASAFLLSSCGGNSTTTPPGGGITKTTPTITWAPPAPITNPAPLGATQLDATASVAGTFAYAPAVGTVLPAGTQTLSTTFTPNDTTHYTTASASVTLTVNPAVPTKTTPTITWAPPAAITNPAPLTATQLDATASVPGTFVYNPAAGTILAAGTQPLSVTFTPTDTTNYNIATATVSLTVNPAPKNSFVYVSETSQDLSTGGVTGTFSGLLEVFQLNASSGALTPITGSPFKTTYSTGDDMVLAPTGSDAYIMAVQYPSGSCCVGPTSILVYALDPSTGTPTYKQAVATPDTGGVLAMHPSGKFLYMLPLNSNGPTLDVYGVQSDGTLALNSSVAANGTDSLSITPDGKYLYTYYDAGPASDWGSNPCGPEITDLYAYSLDPTTGTPTLVSGSPFAFQRQECSVGHTSYSLLTQVDPSGSRLIVTDVGNNSTAAWSIDPTTGALAQLAGITATNATSAVLDPVKPYLYFGYVGGFDGYSLAGSQSTGTLPELPGLPVATTGPGAGSYGSTTMAIDSTGTYLFSNENYYTSAFSCCTPGDYFVQFHIDPSTGSLTQLPSSPASLMGGASKIVVSPAH
jgi:hypothetical protein